MPIAPSRRSGGSSPPGLIAGLTRLVRDVGLAEELAQDALVTALEQWPRTGIPDNPGAWLMATAKNRALDQLRRRKHAGAQARSALRTSSRWNSELSGGKLEASADDEIGDDLLRLIFIACHPLLSTEARTALTLKLLAGLTTEEIARAFLVPEPTIAQRIVRAKRTLAEAQVPFEMPRGEELRSRLASVLEVIYLVFNEGYSATARRGLDAPGAVRGGAAPGSHPRRARPRRAGGARAGGAHGDPGLAPPRAHRAPTASRCCCSSRTARCGTGS